MHSFHVAAWRLRCCFMCFFKWPDVLQEKLQLVQAKCCSPVCESLWYFSPLDCQFAFLIVSANIVFLVVRSSLPITLIDYGADLPRKLKEIVTKIYFFLQKFCCQIVLGLVRNKVVSILHKSIICLVSMPHFYAFSCGSSNHETACLRNRIFGKQRVSRQCAKVCDTSDCLNPCKKSCTDCMQRVFLQNAAACVSWDDQLGCLNSCTGHTWNASPLNVLTCAVWGYLFFQKKRCTGCN